MLRSGEKAFVGGVLRRVIEVRGSRVLIGAGVFLKRSLFFYDQEEGAWYYHG